ncbi:MAG: glycosyltransferase [gamma proteobacterium symbiont of Taylorina sp.]|nr:glycosyltransferase [gamma proteobacterium symbiont of Taylorina sp.]
MIIHNKYSTTRKVTAERPILIQKATDKITSQLYSPKNINRKGKGGLRTKEFFKKSDEHKPLISIITVVYNGEKHLEQTIKSVLEQTYDNVEYIIIDGGSIDGTLGIIKQYEELIDYWVSEPDNGIYSAMNKGISLCSGKYVAFLNADDWYNLNTLTIVAQAINKNNCDYFFGNIDMLKKDVVVSVFTPKLKNYKTEMPFPHPSLFVKRSILLKLGFNETYKIYADYSLALLLMINNYSYCYINKTLAYFRVGGVSTITFSNREYYKLLSEHFGILFSLHIRIVRIKDRIFVELYKIMKKLLIENPQ